MDSVAQMLDRGLQLHMAGKVTEAEPVYRRALELEPQNPAALHLLGVAASQMGRKEEAIQFISRAIEINPVVADFHVNLALVYVEVGNPIKAIPCCQRALQLQPNHADAYNHMGVALGQLSRIDQAVLYLRKALELKENHIDAMTNLAALYQQTGRYEDALVLLDRLQRVRGPSSLTLQQMGDLLRELKRIPEAEAAYKQSVSLDPKSAEGYGGLALILHERGDMAASIPYYEKSLAIKPDQVTVLSNFGLALAATNQLDRAFEVYNRALELRPDFTNALNNLGNAYREQLDMGKTMECYERALFFRPDHPDARWNRSLLQLLLGDFEHGWREYEWRWLKFPEERRNFGQARWDGFDIAGKSILLYAEQGFGDTIQFARYIPLVKERGARVLVECQAELKELMESVGGIDELYERGDTIPLAQFQSPLMSLGRAFKTTVNNIPNAVPYLHAKPEKVAYWREKLRAQEGTFKIGITWAGAARHHRDRERSMKLEHWMPLKSIPGVTWVSLQKGPPVNDPARANFPMVDHTEEINTFADTAALMENLDLVLSVDTSIVHLAGALGRPVWTFMPYLPDWRWLLDREDSPWYPTMKLFRQKVINEWSDPVQRVEQELRHWVASRSA
ncbi:MAG TPA: tetratricopeptide repeat protein [Tepidisphaeraceae bacterium]|jgi:tetratricopeptide (TPR) repeat protein